MAKARPIPGIEAGTRFGDAAGAALETRTREVFEHAARVLDTDDVERVHDMRVATRRLRAALEMFASAFPRKRHKRALRDVKRLADALGARRDPDVAIEQVQEIRGTLQSDDDAAIESLLTELRNEQAAGNERLGSALEEMRASDLEDRLIALAGEARR
jgi:CHAD domain-containing protein